MEESEESIYNVARLTCVMLINNVLQHMDLPDSNGQFNITVSMIETCKTQGISIIKRLGQGSYGAVFLCKRINYKGKHMKLALKVTDTNTADPKFVDKFLQREIDILMQIRHPFIIYIYCIAQRRRKYYVYMRYAEQGDLLDYLTKTGKVQESRARIWSSQMACALQYLHHQQIAHRDIKCENILITAHNNTKLSDFGFATTYSSCDGEAIPLTTFCGTRQYACTEILNSTPYDPEKADMWALGVVLFIMVNGHTPFKGNSPKKVIENQRKPLEYKKGASLSQQLIALFPKIFHPVEKRRMTVREFLFSDWLKMDARFKKDAVNVERPQEFSILAKEDKVRRQFIASADRNNLLGGDREIAYKPSIYSSYISTGIQMEYDYTDLSLLVVCPFNAHHHVSRRKLQYHISKCVKDYRGSKVACPYNASEFIEPTELSAHLANCTSMWARVSHNFSLKQGNLVSNDIQNKPEAPFCHSDLPIPNESWGLE